MLNMHFGIVKKRYSIMVCAVQFRSYCQVCRLGLEDIAPYAKHNFHPRHSLSKSAMGSMCLAQGHIEPRTPWSVVAKLTLSPARPFDGTIGLRQAKLSKRSFGATRALAHGFNYFLLSFIHNLLLFWYSLLDILTIKYYMI